MNKKSSELIINYELFNQFIEENNFILITDEILKKNNMYKDIVYATDNNFIGKCIYPKDMPIIINKGVWEKLIKINNDLFKYGLCIKIYDAYRPIEIQRKLWDEFYNVYGYYDEALVANPNKYGTHNITINAVDITLVDLNGNKVVMPSEFDDFSGKANIYYDKCGEKEKYNRDLLINIANKHGLLVNDDEWWHYYDCRLINFGMEYDYLKTEFIPIGEKDVFLLK